MRSILEYLEKSAAIRPNKISFEDENEKCTYLELLHRSKAIGSSLSYKISSLKPIPVLMEKGVQAIYAFLGIVYAGCFYIHLDPRTPAGRLNQILDILDAEIIISSPVYAGCIQNLSFKGVIVDVNQAAQEKINNFALEQIKSMHLDTDPLYIIFTSGSTGVPKGVVVSHKSVIDFIEDFTEIFHIDSEDIIGNQAPFDFDVSVKDIYSTLKTGATMYIIPKRLFSFPAKLLDCLEAQQITTLIWAVSALCIITSLKGFTYKIPSKIKKVIFSGEVMPIYHLNQWRHYLPQVLYANVYGPTEITCNCTYYIIDHDFAQDDKLPIGHPFPNKRVFLLDEKDNIISEPGIKGELCVSGAALSLGYYGDWEETKKVFVQNPHVSNYQSIMYRTGDLAYYGKDGNLYFSSRKDYQVKYMGHRIELEEIEIAMQNIEGIYRVCCYYDQVDNRIVAFYECDGGIGINDIMKELKYMLPEIMIPKAFYPYKLLPITSNGKIDRQELIRQYYLKR